MLSIERPGTGHSARVSVERVPIRYLVEVPDEGTTAEWPFARAPRTIYRPVSPVVVMNRRALGAAVAIEIIVRVLKRLARGRIGAVGS
jgi:hypothetical protein